MSDKFEIIVPDATTKITQSIIANQVAYNFNHNILFNKRYYKHELKRYLNLVQKELAKAERTDYDMLFDANPDATAETYQALEDMVNEIGSLGLMHFANITEMVKAYKTDAKSIIGIANKITR